VIRGAWTIAAREIDSLFRLPVGWIVVALYAFLSALVFVQTTLVPGGPGTMRYFFASAVWMMVPIAPAISMRLFSEEARSGTIEMLRTAPVGDFAVALGKFLGAWLFLGITLAPTLILPITLAFVSEPRPEPGPILTGYLTLFLVGGLYLGIGLVASALTSSQTLAFLGTMMAIVLLMMVTSLAGPLQMLVGPRAQELATAFSVTARVDELAKGVLDTAAVAFFLIGAGWAVVIAAGVLESHRLARPRPLAVGLWAGFLLATGASAVLLGVLSHDLRARVDVTTSGTHRLSPRADRMVGLLDAPTELLFAIDMSGADRRAVDLVTDVLKAYDRASDLLTLRVIDLGSPAGITQTDELLGVLAARESERVGRVTAALRSAVTAMRAAAAEADALARDLDAVRDAIAPTDSGAITNLAYFDQRGGLLRLGARTLTEQAESVTTALDSPAGPAGLAETDRLLPQALATWTTQRTQMSELTEQTRAYAQSDIANPNAAALARAASDRAERLRDAAAVAAETLERLPRLDTLRVARALETGESLLVIGPPVQGIAAVDLEALLPPTEVLERAGLSAAGVIGPRAQELVATAIGRLVRPDRPIVVFTHAENPGVLLGENGFFTGVADRLREREIDSLEWAALAQAEPPDLARLDPTGLRPVVFAVISPDSTAGSGGGRLTGAQRATELAAVTQRLIDAGEPVLLNLNPSVFPTYGDPDPLARLAEPFGIAPRTGLAVLRSTPGGASGTVFDPFLTVVPDPQAEDPHPAADAARGLRTMLPWATPIDLIDAPNATAAPLVELTGEAAAGVWAESRWLRLRSLTNTQRTMLTDQPVFNPNEDEQRAKWILAAAGERTSPLGVSRLIVVGSNGWASDGAVVGATQLVDGRVTARFPGNAVMLDACVHWLAGLDDLIAPGAQDRSVATVRTLGSTQISTLRWILLAAVPGIILLAGVTFRALRG
jgi:ABC-2 type transport system permease protein